MGWTKKQLSILLVVSVTSFMGTFLVSGINIALPSIEKTFHLDAIQLSWIITSFLLATGMFLLPAGKWGDILGNGKLYKTGLIIFTFASLLCAVAPNGTWLIVARFLQGVGSAFSNTTGQAILVSGFPPKNRGQVLGISVASVYTGLALGPFIGGILTQHAGWHSLFYIAVAMGIIATIIAFIFLEKDTPSADTRKKMDWRGTIVFMTGLSALVYGSVHMPNSLGWILMMGGVSLLIVFWIIEGSGVNPLLDTRLFTRNKLFAYSSTAALINYTATFAIVFFLSLYLQKIQGFSPQKAGSILIAQPLVMALFSPVVGKLSDKIQPRYFATLGMAMCSVGLAALAFLSADMPVWLIVAILIWEGLGFAFFSSPNMNTIMSSVDRSRYGQASGIAASMRVFGQIISMTITMLFFTALFGNLTVEAVEDTVFLTAMKWSFLTFFLISLAGIYFSFTRGNMERFR